MSAQSQPVAHTPGERLIAAWKCFYQALPDGEYVGLGEMRAAMFALGWDAAEQALARAEARP